MKIGWMVIINELQKTCERQVIKLFFFYVATLLYTASKLVNRRSKVQLLLRAVGFFLSTVCPQWSLKDKCLISFISQGKSLPSHLPWLLIFHNHFYRRKEGQEELQKAKLIISLFSSSLCVLTEGVAGDVLSRWGALPGSPNRVVSSRPQAICTPEWQP